MNNEMEQNVTSAVTVSQLSEEHNGVIPVYDYEFFNLYVRGIFNSIIIILGWIFNICTIITLWDEKKNNGTSFLLICLAVADNLVLLSGSIFVVVPR